MRDEYINQFLNISLIVLVCALIIFVIFFLLISIKSAKEEKEFQKKSKGSKGEEALRKSSKEYSKESIFDFMEFEKIEDNMIIQKKGKFLMVVECQGVNYDLMSELEKVSVEQGFLEFLNTLRYPVQLYIQTRTVNLENSINKYKDKLNVIENQYNDLKIKYQKVLQDEEIDDKEIQKLNYDVIKQRNLYEYTSDIIKNIEKTSLNSNVLSKKYYIILPYYRDEMIVGDFSYEEIQSMVFSELYTRARSVINTLFSCQINAKVLDSMGLIELLYASYNRDESDNLRAEAALNAGFQDLYSTATDIIDKKMKALDMEVERKAKEYAVDVVEETKKEKEYNKKRENLNNLVMQLAKGIIEHDKAVIGESIATDAIKKIDNNLDNDNKSKEGESNVLEKETKRRGRPRKG